jgi:cell division inhibitor SepF
MAGDAHRDLFERWGLGDPPVGDFAPSSAGRLELVRRQESTFHLIAPDDFDAAQQVADLFREGEPVVVDLQDCDRLLAGRLIDFCSGLVYALDGTLQHVGREVVMLLPSRASLSGDEHMQIREPGFFNRS